MVHAPFSMVHAPPLVQCTIWVVKTKPLELERWLKKRIGSIFHALSVGAQTLLSKPIPFKLNPKNWFLHGARPSPRRHSFLIRKMRKIIFSIKMNMYSKVKLKKNGGYGFAFFEIFVRNTIFVAKMARKTSKIGVSRVGRQLREPLFRKPFNIFW